MLSTMLTGGHADPQTHPLLRSHECQVALQVSSRVDCNQAVQFRLDRFVPLLGLQAAIAKIVEQRS